MQLLVIYTKIVLPDPEHSPKIRSIRTPKSGVSGPIPGVSPEVSQTQSIRTYTRSFARSVPNPEYPDPNRSDHTGHNFLPSPS